MALAMLGELRLMVIIGMCACIGGAAYAVATYLIHCSYG